MRNLLLVPSVGSDDFVVDAADLAEITAVFRADGLVSREDLASALRRASSISEDRARERAGDVFEELADRVESCGRQNGTINRYPFSLDSTGTLLSRKRAFRPDSDWALVYWFLLFVTRADMGSKARVLDSIDPTATFEMLCSDVLADFWGGRSSFSGTMLMGTAGRTATVSQFKSKIGDLCRSAGLGVGWKLGARPPGAGDAKLDVAAWRRFADGRQGGLIGFAQCKTGIHWKEHLTKLRPETFCRRFFQQLPAVLPVRLYMVPNRIVLGSWEQHSSDGGILMDRCRILQYSRHVSPETLRMCKRWVREAHRLQKGQRVTI